MMEAEDLAEQGKVTAGMSILHTGLLRAEADREIGQPWAEELIRRYNRAMDRYAEQHRLRSEAIVCDPTV
jgi:hypothetical protein